jgi:hypothetical protein
MRLIYLVLAGGACSLSIVAIQLYRAFRARCLTSFRRDFPPPSTGARVRLPKPRPGSSGAAEAKAEVEGSPFSIVP